MGETIVVDTSGGSVKRLRRTAEEKGRIVEATFVPGASIARVAREHGVNANQVFNIWSVTVLQAKNEGGGLVCANVYGLFVSNCSWHLMECAALSS